MALVVIEVVEMWLPLRREARGVLLEVVEVHLELLIQGIINTSIWICLCAPSTGFSLYRAKLVTNLP